MKGINGFQREHSNGLSEPHATSPAIATVLETLLREDLAYLELRNETCGPTFVVIGWLSNLYGCRDPPRERPTDRAFQKQVLENRVFDSLKERGITVSESEPPLSGYFFYRGYHVSADRHILTILFPE
jgi:hypothetical protein